MTSLTLPLTTQAWRTKWRTGELTNQHVLAFLVIAYVLAAIALDPVAYWFVFSKKLLKVTTMSNIKKVGNRYYAHLIRMENRLKKGTWTEMEMTNLEFKVTLPSQVFSLRNLQRE